jgi:glycosyltransferase involved in cell wall biosynthesis
MLDETVAYLNKRAAAAAERDPFTFEIVLVDDGSKDETVKVASKYALDNKLEDVFRILKLEKNRGKGGAVTQVEMKGLELCINRAVRCCSRLHSKHNVLRIGFNTCLLL